jgi:hypothetical protein
MSLESEAGSAQTCDRGLGNDGLEQGGDELTEHAPCARPCQAASAKRGESSSSSTSGSSRRMISR